MQASSAVFKHPNALACSFLTVNLTKESCENVPVVDVLQGSSKVQRCEQSLPPLQAEVLHAVSSALA